MSETNKSDKTFSFGGEGIKKKWDQLTQKIQNDFSNILKKFDKSSSKTE